jgi:hypothetical protein
MPNFLFGIGIRALLEFDNPEQSGGFNRLLKYFPILSTKQRV